MAGEVCANEGINPLVSKINLIAFVAILLPYINQWLATVAGVPIILEPNAVVDGLFALIIVVRTLWTQCKTTLTR